MKNNGVGTMIIPGTNAAPKIQNVPRANYPSAIPTTEGGSRFQQAQRLGNELNILGRTKQPQTSNGITNIPDPDYNNLPVKGNFKGAYFPYNIHPMDRGLDKTYIAGDLMFVQKKTDKQEKTNNNFYNMFSLPLLNVLLRSGMSYEKVKWSEKMENAQDYQKNPGSEQSVYLSILKQRARRDIEMKNVQMTNMVETQANGGRIVDRSTIVQREIIEYDPFEKALSDYEELIEELKSTNRFNKSHPALKKIEANYQHLLKQRGLMRNKEQEYSLLENNSMGFRNMYIHGILNNFNFLGVVDVNNSTTDNPSDPKRSLTHRTGVHTQLNICLYNSCRIFNHWGNVGVGDILYLILKREKIVTMDTKTEKKTTSYGAFQFYPWSANMCNYAYLEPSRAELEYQDVSGQYQMGHVIRIGFVMEPKDPGNLHNQIKAESREQLAKIAGIGNYTYEESRNALAHHPQIEVLLKNW